MPVFQDYTAGLSWKEEKELKKALMASLQESKKPTKPELSESLLPDEELSLHQHKKLNRKPNQLKLQIPQPGGSSSNGQGPASRNGKRCDCRIEYNVFNRIYMPNFALTILYIVW